MSMFAHTLSSEELKQGWTRFCPLIKGDCTPSCMLCLDEVSEERKEDGTLLLEHYYACAFAALAAAFIPGEQTCGDINFSDEITDSIDTLTRNFKTANHLK